ncbi:hypothetical protein ACJX0J_029983 [Zea mays]
MILAAFSWDLGTTKQNMESRVALTFFFPFLSALELLPYIHFSSLTCLVLKGFVILRYMHVIGGGGGGGGKIVYLLNGVAERYLTPDFFWSTMSADFCTMEYDESPQYAR